MRNKKGFTLVEMILVVSLLAVSALLMYSFFGQGLKLFTYESASADRQMNMREVLSDITNKARLTDSSDITCSSGTLNVGSYAYTLNSGKIKRNGTVISTGISTFTTSINESGILEITVVDTAGTSLTTSISLL
jgi:prepilin-type N-terminal cleavage/methylation domain-containing protein